MSWDYDLAKEIRRSTKTGAAPLLIKGTVVKTSPLTVAVCDGEVLAPPMPLECVSSAQGNWVVGQKVICCLVDNTLVILGRLS